MSLTTSTPSGGNVTVTLTRTGATAKINATMTDAGHYVWQDILDANGNVVTDFNTATNIQKLAQLETAIVNVIVSWAKQYNTDSDLAASKTTIESENANNYIL
jgi:hypothetical protein